MEYLSDHKEEQSTQSEEKILKRLKRQQNRKTSRNLLGKSLDEH